MSFVVTGAIAWFNATSSAQFAATLPIEAVIAGRIVIAAELAGRRVAARR